MAKENINQQPTLDMAVNAQPDPSKSSSSSPPTDIRLEDIDSDASLQVRIKMDSETVDNYCDALGRGDQFPPIDVFRVNHKLIIANGRHRYEAHKRLGKKTIAAHVLDGDIRAAKLHAIKADTNVGLRRTREDKRRAVEWLLEDSEWKKWSAGVLAAHAGVSDRYVDKIRKELEANGKIAVTDTVKAKRNGKEVEVKKKPKKQDPQPKPAVSPTEAAPVITKSDLIVAVETLIALMQRTKTLSDVERTSLDFLVDTIKARTGNGGV